jgi:hypothetical protein
MVALHAELPGQFAHLAQSGFARSRRRRTVRERLKCRAGLLRRPKHFTIAAANRSRSRQQVELAVELVLAAEIKKSANHFGPA